LSRTFHFVVSTLVPLNSSSQTRFHPVGPDVDVVVELVGDVVVELAGDVVVELVADVVVELTGDVVVELVGEVVVELVGDVVVELVDVLGLGVGALDDEVMATSSMTMDVPAGIDDPRTFRSRLAPEVRATYLTVTYCQVRPVSHAVPLAWPRYVEPEYSIRRTATDWLGLSVRIQALAL